MAIAFVFSVISAIIPVVAGNLNSGENLLFDNRLIYGDSYKKITSGKKIADGSTVTVIVSLMLNDSGDKSNYTKSRWTATKNGVLITTKEYVAVLDTQCKMALTSKIKKTETIVISAKGNTSTLDAIISGKVYNFNE